MSSSGGKGGSQTSSASIPSWAQDAMIHNLGRAQQAAEIGYQPYYGPEEAAFNPTQVSAMDNANLAASAFGLGSPGGSVADSLPQSQNFNGVQGYSSQPLFQESLYDWNRGNPSQTAQYSQLFVPMFDGTQQVQPHTPTIQQDTPAIQPNNLMSMFGGFR